MPSKSSRDKPEGGATSAASTSAASTEEAARDVIGQARASLARASLGQAGLDRRLLDSILNINGQAEPPWIGWNNNGYEAPVGITVDVVLLTVRDGKLLVLIAERPEGTAGLPGGFLRPGEAAEETAARTLEEKTGLERIYLEQLATFTDPKRDARGWIPTIAYLALVPPETEPPDPSAWWVPAGALPSLAFDHNVIVMTALDRVAGKIRQTNLAAGILDKPFTFSEARQVYEAVTNVRYDPSTFARDLKAGGLVAATGEQRITPGRAAALFEFTNKHTLEWVEGRRGQIRD